MSSMCKTIPVWGFLIVAPLMQLPNQHPRCLTDLMIFSDLKSIPYIFVSERCTMI